MAIQNWPAWYYGPDGDSKVVNSADEVPNGWQDHPSKIVTPAKTGSKPVAVVADPLSQTGQTGTQPIPVDQTGATAAATGSTTPADTTTDVSNTLDRDGHPWNADLHAATQTKTNNGLWRMKVGVSRPAPAEGYPKPLLDL